MYIDSLNDPERFRKVMDVLKVSPLWNGTRGDTETHIVVPKQTEVECGAFSCLYMYLAISYSETIQKHILDLFHTRNLSKRTRTWVKDVMRREECFKPQWLDVTV